MGCHFCGRRQADPDSGPSTWRRAVVAGEQVLVCPDCQVDGWTDGLDRCRTCGSTVLVKRLGEVSCRACGAAGTPARGAPTGGSAHPAAPPPGAPDPASPRAALIEDVAAALERVLRGDRT